jgi:hypothetical protein
VEVRGAAGAGAAEPPLPDPDSYGESDPDMILSDDEPSATLDDDPAGSMENS